MMLSSVYEFNETIEALTIANFMLIQKTLSYPCNVPLPTHSGIVWQTHTEFGRRMGEDL